MLRIQETFKKHLRLDLRIYQDTSILKAESLVLIQRRRVMCNKYLMFPEFEYQYENDAFS